jgi:CRP/FNR family transcriptional regulator
MSRYGKYVLTEDYRMNLLKTEELQLNKAASMNNADSLKLWYLNRINLLKDLPMEDLNFIAHCSIMGKHKKVEIVYFQGDPANQVYFLKEGRVKLSRVSPDGREITLAILDKGEIFGELSVSGIATSNVQAQVMQDTILCAIRKEDFIKVMERNHELAFSITKFIGFRRHQIECKLEDMIFKDVPTRLADALLSLKEQYGQKETRGTKLGISLSHQELANLIGATSETVSAFLAQWKRDGIIDSERRSTILVNEKALQEISKNSTTRNSVPSV